MYNYLYNHTYLYILIVAKSVLHFIKWHAYQLYSTSAFCSSVVYSEMGHVAFPNLLWVTSSLPGFRYWPQMRKENIQNEKAPKPPAKNHDQESKI